MSKPRLPYKVTEADLLKWKSEPLLPFPDRSDMEHPKGFTKTQIYFVDSSGLGAPGEAALTIPAFLARLKAGCYYAITGVGQFQVFVTEYTKGKPA
ncbi:MAG: hypothetical protein Q7R68_10825 [Nitrospirales bacterium]|nr:hypothetical protein [Nitrospirales bacterium]